MGPNGGTSVLAEPGDAPPARRRDAVDQRRDAAPVDDAGRRDRAVPEGRQRRLRPRHVVRRDRQRRSRPATGYDVRGAGATTNPGPGSMTFYYTNQQSARLMFYHDHAYGITRLNVYAGEAAGYLRPGPGRAGARNGGHPGTPPTSAGPSRDQIPLVIEDKTFVPSTTQLAAEDPTWNTTATTAATATSGSRTSTCRTRTRATSAARTPMGRWDYGHWFWPDLPDPDTRRSRTRSAAPRCPEHLPAR